MLDKKVRQLSSENQMFLTQLMDLKEKQIEKFNQAHELYTEVESMRQKLELANLAPETLLVISEIMKSQSGAAIASEGENGSDPSSVRMKMEDLKKKLMKSVKEATIETMKEQSNMMRMS